MIIRFKELAKKTNAVQDEIIDLTDVLQGRGDLLSFGPLHVHLQAQYITEDETVDVTGQLSMEVEQPCSRCLIPVKQKLDIPFHEKFALAANQSGPDNEHEDIHIVKDEKIELKPYLAEHVALALPFVPLCDQACQGLCPTCGINRNLQACSCNQEKLDPRLAGLADFFKE